MSCCPGCDHHEALQREWQRVAHSPLWRSGGMAVLVGLLDADMLAAMADEAWQGARTQCAHPHCADEEQVRGGTPARQLASIEGGAVQQSLYGHPGLAALIAARCGSPVRPCGAQASYSVYDTPGAHLGIHRDIPGCDLALITCLEDSAPASEGGATESWPDDVLTPLGILRGGAGGRSRRTALLPGHSMLMHGGVLPHRIRPLAAGRLRVVSLMCFEMLA